MTQTTDLSALPQRRGEGPDTNPRMPHQQVSQNAPAELQEALFERAATLPGVMVGRSHVSVPGARAFHLDNAHAAGSQDAFMVGTEFAHLHPHEDGSLHLILPEPLARQVIERGWGEFHPLVQQGMMPPTNLMVFGPRDAEELEIVWSIVEASYANATSQRNAGGDAGATQSANAARASNPKGES
jgi:phospholipase/carboxylesterase